MASSEPWSLAPVPASLLAQLATVPDPRIERTKHHQLVDLLAIALLAVLCGADDFTEIAQFGRARRILVREQVDLVREVAERTVAGPHDRARLAALAAVAEAAACP